MKQGEIWLIDLDPTVGAEMNKVFFLTFMLMFSQFSFSNNFRGEGQEISIDGK